MLFLLLIGLGARFFLISVAPGGAADPFAASSLLRLALAVAVLVLLALEAGLWCSVSSARPLPLFPIAAWVQLALWILSVPALSGAGAGLLGLVCEAALHASKIAAYVLFPKPAI